MIAVSPVFDDTVSLERTFGASQEEYTAIPALVGMGRITVRLAMSQEERAALQKEGNDIVLTILTFNRPLQPFSALVCSRGNVLENEAILDHCGIYSSSRAADKLESLLNTAHSVDLAILDKGEEILQMCRTLQQHADIMCTKESAIKMVEAAIEAAASLTSNPEEAAAIRNITKAKVDNNI